MLCIRKIGLIKVAIILALLSVLIMPAMSQDLTGKWQADVGGGVYYMRQMGNQLFWLGEQQDSNPAWCNVAQGFINSNTVFLFWADVPKGGITNGGILILNIVNPNQLVITNSDRGGFGANSFTRESPIPPSNLVELSLYPCKLQWKDNSNDEDGFNIYIGGSCVNCVENKAWNKIASVGANIDTYSWGKSCCDVGECSCVMVRAFKGNIESSDSNKIMLAPVC